MITTCTRKVVQQVSVGLCYEGFKKFSPPGGLYLECRRLGTRHVQALTPPSKASGRGTDIIIPSKLVFQYGP